MLPESIVAGTLALLALLFFVVRSVWDSRKLPRDHAVEEIGSALLVLGYAGLGAFALITIAYPVLYALGRLDLLTRSVLQLRFPGDTIVQLAGMALLAAGMSLVFWSLHAIAPGTLTVGGPYARVRHPMYTGYFFVFTGLFGLTLNLLALVPLLAVPGLVAVARREEVALAARYGMAYRAYAARTGRFWPRIPWRGR